MSPNNPITFDQKAFNLLPINQQLQLRNPNIKLTLEQLVEIGIIKIKITKTQNRIKSDLIKTTKE
ncbi:hypothetical protein ACFL21_01730 [Patescibacteria group bacterium]